MQVITIDNEIPRNVARCRVSLYEEFTKRTTNYIAEQCNKGVLMKAFENPITRASIFFKLIDEQYTGLLRETVEEVKATFAKHGIEFRLYDITAVIHQYHRMILLWNIDGMEYSFDFLWDSARFDPEAEHNPFPAFYRTGLVNRCGDIADGDILGLPEKTIQPFEFEKDLPSWFVSGLKQNS